MSEYIEESEAMELLGCERPAQLRGIREKYLASGYHYARVRGVRCLKYHKGRLEEWQQEQYAPVAQVSATEGQIRRLNKAIQEYRQGASVDADLYWPAIELAPDISEQVYLLGVPELRALKIGYTKKSLHNRFGVIQTGLPVPLVVVASFEGDVSQESALQHKHRELNMRGEWFQWDRSIVEDFEARCIGQKQAHRQRLRKARKDAGI